MINNYIRIFAILTLPFFLDGCNKEEVEVEKEPEKPYVSDSVTLRFSGDGFSFESCGIFLTMPSLTTSFWINPDSPNYGKLTMDAASVENCDPTANYHFREKMRFSFKPGVIEPKPSVYDLKDEYFIDYISFVHYGDNFYGDFSPGFHQRFDKVIDGQLKIDSVLMPNAEFNNHGKVYGTFWIDLGMSDESIEKGHNNDTLEITSGYFDINIFD